MEGLLPIEIGGSDADAGIGAPQYICQRCTLKQRCSSRIRAYQSSDEWTGCIAESDQECSLDAHATRDVAGCGSRSTAYIACGDSFRCRTGELLCTRPDVPAERGSSAGSDPEASP